MKRILFALFATLFIATAGFAQSGRKTDKAENQEIHWMTLDEAQVAMNKEPRKVWIDVYTDWCGWCKRMDKTTFQDPNVIRYMNEHFYAVRLNAEQREDIRFMGKMYKADPSDRTHPFAKELLHDQLSYPTSVFMEENFQTPQLIPGYQDVKTMELILKYLGEGFYRKVPFKEYQASFKPSWN